ncbi:hypothetical protein PVAP13_5NG244400 [Panicum virgatum]|uniref:Peptidase A1 domain-containing protein n=1 Tax=Panicum virgatum TaxID=38727 RepID=A0A8T0RXQ4_PANVG|nr:hypothetical protein PVAP13_5NG244400 [Panicum virgatum]
MRCRKRRKEEKEREEKEMKPRPAGCHPRRTSGCRRWRARRHPARRGRGSCPPGRTQRARRRSARTAPGRPAGPGASSPPSGAPPPRTTTGSRGAAGTERPPSTWSCSCWRTSTTAMSSGSEASPRATAPGSWLWHSLHLFGFTNIGMDMRAMRWMLLLLLMFVPQIALFTGGDAMSFPPVLSLERRVQLKATAVKQLMQLDMARHATGRRLTGEGQGTTGVVKLPVIGSTDNNVGSPYLTRVKLGSPPKEFTALVDTGSDTLWFTCRPCSGCPEPSGLSQRNFYDPWLSSTSTVIGCSDKWCRDSIKNRLASCDTYHEHGLCGYNFIYESGASAGYYVSDEISLDTVGENIPSFSATIKFGCSNLQSGGLAQTGLGFDGIVGMGPNRNRLSLNSQLNSLGISPMVFSLCLESSGNGVLVLNEAVDQRMVYTPLLESKSYYSLNLESISVNGEILPIDSSVFTSGQRKTIVDSGTTLAYFADQAYDPFINAVVAAVSPSVQTSVGNDGGPCFLASGSLDDSSFPPVTLNFANGAAMKLKPHNYLLPEILTVKAFSCFLRFSDLFSVIFNTFRVPCLLVVIMWATGRPADILHGLEKTRKSKNNCTRRFVPYV